MINWYLYILLAALVLPRVSIQECTTKEFNDTNALDLLQVTESSENDQTFTVEDINFSCLSTSRVIGIYRSMSVSLWYTRSDTPNRIRDVRYNVLCYNGEWQRYGWHQYGFNSSKAKYDCSDCMNNESDYHCTPCSSSCTGLKQCYGPTASECCNYNDRGNCTLECGLNKEANPGNYCVCSNYWTGDSCDNCSLECNNGTHNSICSGCDCHPGYTGPVCDVDIDECDPNPCQNRGNCTDLINDYICTCATGYTGKSCSVNIDDCGPNSCLNGGSCIDKVNSYTCNCVAGFTGAKCETNIDECSNDPCQNGGSCTDGINAYTCTCMAGYNGTNCESDIDECSSNPCQNGGTCTDQINGYTCACRPIYTGPECSDCVMKDCDQCIESEDFAVGECTKCTGAYVLDQGTCNDNCGISQCIVCNKRNKKCKQCKEGYHLSNDGKCEGEKPDEDIQFIIMIVMLVVVLIIIVAIMITSTILYYEYKKPKRRKQKSIDSRKLLERREQNSINSRVLQETPV